MTTLGILLCCGAVLLGQIAAVRRLRAPLLASDDEAGGSEGGVAPTRHGRL